MNMKPFLITVLNKTKEELYTLANKVNNSMIEYNFNAISLYNVDDFNDLIFINSKEDLDMLKSIFTDNNIEVDISHKKAHKYIFENQNIFKVRYKQYDIPFVILVNKYILENFDQDDVYQKIKENKELSELDKFILENEN